MIGVFVFGFFLERIIGHLRVAIIYIVSAAGGAWCAFLVAQWPWFSPDYSPSSIMQLHIGASGAVFGLLGVLLVPSRRLDRNYSGVLGFLAVNALYMVFNTNISWQGHIGGLIVGFVLGLPALLAPPRFRTATTILSAAAVVAAIAISLIFMPTPQVVIH